MCAAVNPRVNLDDWAKVCDGWAKFVMVGQSL